MRNLYTSLEIEWVCDASGCAFVPTSHRNATWPTGFVVGLKYA